MKDTNGHVKLLSMRELKSLSSAFANHLFSSRKKIGKKEIKRLNSNKDAAISGSGHC